jgi:hypothetical protein
MTTILRDKCACFSVNLETTLREEIKPDDFDKWLAECQAEFAIVKRHYSGNEDRSTSSTTAADQKEICHKGRRGSRISTRRAH